MSAQPDAPRRFAIAVVSVPCPKEVGGCGAEPEQECVGQQEHWKAPRYHRTRTELARRVGLEYLDTIDEIDKLPTTVERVR